MVDEKIHCMEVARRYQQAFWDGDRRYGYGGYRYDGRWKVVAQRLIDQYRLADDAVILDVGCGKGFLLYELSALLPRATVVGFDISRYALREAKAELSGKLIELDAAASYPFADQSFDLVISLTTLHNLPLPELDRALREIARVGRDGYLVVESFRNTTELFNLQCWALTCESFLRPESWCFVFDRAGYRGDYEFIYFE